MRQCDTEKALCRNLIELNLTRINEKLKVKFMNSQLIRFDESSRPCSVSFASKIHQMEIYLSLPIFLRFRQVRSELLPQCTCALPFLSDFSQNVFASEFLDTVPLLAVFSSFSSTKLMVRVLRLVANHPHLSELGTSIISQNSATSNNLG